ncbi:DUF1653 domain-containing protein [Paenibacillus amylolyticus]|uniref:DUF1653 domain-containing protein n=1 Tax=Paenibacillus sp. M2 TaxID=3341793 RepID=UPI000B81B828
MMLLKVRSLNITKVVHINLYALPHTEQQVGLTVYMDDNNQVWARPVDMFFGYTDDGTKRFVEINEWEENE